MKRKCSFAHHRDKGEHVIVITLYHQIHFRAINFFPSLTFACSTEISAHFYLFSVSVTPANKLPCNVWVTKLQASTIAACSSTAFTINCHKVGASRRNLICQTGKFVEEKGKACKLLRCRRHRCWSNVKRKGSTWWKKEGVKNANEEDQEESSQDVNSSWIFLFMNAILYYS